MLLASLPATNISASPALWALLAAGIFALAVVMLAAFVLIRSARRQAV